MSKVIVITHKNADGSKGPIVKQSTEKPEWGTVLVMTTSPKMVNGIFNEGKRIAAFRAKFSQLQSLGLKEGDDLNEFMTSKYGDGAWVAQGIFRKETTTPQYEGHKAKINPTTKAPVLTAGGQNIYSNDILLDVVGNSDELISSAAQTTAVQQNAAEKVGVGG